MVSMKMTNIRTYYLPVYQVWFRWFLVLSPGPGSKPNISSPRPNLLHVQLDSLIGYSQPSFEYSGRRLYQYNEDDFIKVLIVNKRITSLQVFIEKLF